MKPLGLFWGNVSVVLHVMLTDTRHSSLWWARFTKVKTNRTNNQRLKNTQIKPKPPPSPHFTCQPVWLSMAKAHKSSMRFGEEHCWGPIAIISWNLCLVIKSWENWLHNLFLESESTNLQGNCLQLGTPKKKRAPSNGMYYISKQWFGICVWSILMLTSFDFNWQLVLRPPEFNQS